MARLLLFALDGAHVRPFYIHGANVRGSEDTTPCRMTGVTWHSHVHYKEIGPHVLRTPGVGGRSGRWG